MADVIHRGQVWYRRGTQNAVAMHDDLRRMFKGDDPIADEWVNGPIITQTSQHYRALGRETVLLTWNSREAKLLAGFEFAYFPGTRRLVVVIPYGHSEPDVVLMLRPASE
jgi:hypothetical protein